MRNIIKISAVTLTIIIIQSCKKEADNTIRDIDGNVYASVSIGTQVWMVENLKTTKYNDGTAIPLVTDGAAWQALLTPGYCWYDNDAATYKATCGALYNWYVVDALSNSGKNVCPTGWHVPSDAEWTTLTDYLTNNGYGYGGSGEDIAKSMAATSGWTTDPTAGNVGNNQTSNNSSGFTALPSGNRVFDGTYYYVGSNAYWWSSSEYYTTYAYNRDMYYDYSSVGSYSNSKLHGFSVRCLRDN
jgi:uncharacterized protein (TIGR02145 family)